MNIGLAKRVLSAPQVGTQQPVRGYAREPDAGVRVPRGRGRRRYCRCMSALGAHEPPHHHQAPASRSWERERAALIAECTARIERERRDRDEAIGELLERIAHLERSGDAGRRA